MIPVATRAKVIDNLPGEEIAFTIGNPQWVMKSLTKLYSSPILATIREYSTNARDSHVESGKTDLPIKVTLPTLYHPYFEVEDFGGGMSEDELKSTYTQYGTSTKRNSNAVNGMLGFGSKSALAYADSFTVTARKSGIETVAVISRKPDYTVTMKVIAVSPTNESNGVKVQIPSHDYDAFRRIAMDFYRFWLPGTVEVDGVCPEWAVGEKLGDNLYYSKTPGTSYVVMGNVAYRIANPEVLFSSRNMRSISFVAYVPNGSCEFTPSREDLEYTAQTKQTLHNVIEDFEKKIIAQAKSDIATATDYFDAYTKYMYWSNKLGRGPFGDLEFNGEKFIEDISIEAYRYIPYEYRYNTIQISRWSVSQMSDTLIVTGVTNDKAPSSTHKQRTKQYRDEILDIRARYILFTTADKVESVWIDQKRVVSWETVKAATKKPKQAGSGVYRPTRISGTFDYVLSYVDTATGELAVKWIYQKDIPEDTPLYYISVNDEKVYKVVGALVTTQTRAAVVKLAINRIDKFIRENPQAKSFVDEFKAKVNLNGIDFLDKNARESLAIGDKTRGWLNKLNVDNINDPEFKRLKNLLDEENNIPLKAYNDAFALAKSMQMRYDFKKHNIIGNNDSLIEKYPLLWHASYNYAPPSLFREYEIYINAKYAAVIAASKKGN